MSVEFQHENYGKHLLRYKIGLLFKSNYCGYSYFFIYKKKTFLN